MDIQNKEKPTLVYSFIYLHIFDIAYNKDIIILLFLHTFSLRVKTFSSFKARLSSKHPDKKSQSPRDYDAIVRPRRSELIAWFTIV